MNANFKTKLLLKLANKKANKGFTLIELLVVTIIVGVLAAVALPNLLNQVGKAREVEAKNGMGTINRAQQAYHFERETFAAADPSNQNNALGVVIKSQYYNFPTTAGSATNATASTTPVNATKDGVRNYGAAIVYDGGTASYNTAICQSDIIGGTATPDVSTLTDAKCATGSKEIEG